MMRSLFILMCFAVAIHAQFLDEMDEIDANEVEGFVTFNERNYTFVPGGLASSWGAAESYCVTQLGMEMPGLETENEWIALSGYMRSTGKTGLYWTNGASTDGTTWQWGAAPQPTFDDRDPRWATKEPKDGNPNFATHHVAYDAYGTDNQQQNGNIYSEADDIYHNVFCEGPAIL